MSIFSQNNPQKFEHKLPIKTYLLVLMQIINLSMAVLSVSVGALVGTKLAPSAAIGTLPYALQFLLLMLCTYSMSKLMHNKGAGFIFYLGSVALSLAGIVGFMALQMHQFILLCMAHMLLGIYLSAANFTRFVASNDLNADLKAKAISMVILGGVFAAFLGPLLAMQLRHVWFFDLSIKEFALCYGVMSLFAIINALLVYIWNRKTEQFKHLSTSIDLTTLSKNANVLNNIGNLPKIASISIQSQLSKTQTLNLLSAILTASVGYLIMNLLMIQSSLKMVSFCSFNQSSQAIQWHVLAMFLPSLLTGKFIHKFGYAGNWLLIHLSFLGMALASIWGMVFSGYQHIAVELIILGVAWNFSYVGGSTLLASQSPEAIKHKIQGINDTLIALFATMGAFLPAPLYTHFGWQNTHLMLFFTCVIMLIFNGLIHWRTRLNLI